MTIQELFIQIVVFAIALSAWCAGLHVAATKDVTKDIDTGEVIEVVWRGVLSPVKEWLISHVGKRIMNPILECVNCMPSIHGLLFYLTLYLCNIQIHPLAVIIGIVASVKLASVFRYHK